MIDLLYNIAAHLSNVEEICGPAFRKIHAIFEHSFQQLKSCGVELHFFAHGPVYNHDVPTWTSKESANYSARIALIDVVNANVPIDEIKKLETPAGATSSTYDLLTICEKYGTVHVPLSSKYVVDVVKFSNENQNVLAIVAIQSIGNSA